MKKKSFFISLTQIENLYKGGDGEKSATPPNYFNSSSGITLRKMAVFPSCDE